MLLTERELLAELERLDVAGATLLTGDDCWVTLLVEELLAFPDVPETLRELEVCETLRELEVCETLRELGVCETLRVPEAFDTLLDVEACDRLRVCAALEVERTLRLTVEAVATCLSVVERLSPRSQPPFARRFGAKADARRAAGDTYTEL